MGVCGGVWKETQTSNEGNVLVHLSRSVLPGHHPIPNGLENDRVVTHEVLVAHEG